jgi:hypothetical protein
MFEPPGQRRISSRRPYYQAPIVRHHSDFRDRHGATVRRHVS